MQEKPLLGISTCLLGHKVRYVMVDTSTTTAGRDSGQVR